MYLEAPSFNDLLDLIDHAYPTCVYVPNSCEPK